MKLDADRNTKNINFTTGTTVTTGRISAIFGTNPACHNSGMFFPFQMTWVVCLENMEGFLQTTVYEKLL